MTTTALPAADISSVTALARAARASWSRFAAGVRRHYRQRRAAAQLHALDDRILRDMGVSRSDINSLVRGNRPG